MDIYLSRLKAIMFEKKMSETAFAKALKVGQSTVNNAFSRGTCPKMSFVENVLTTFRVNPLWFFSGQGEMFLSDTSERSPPQKSDSDEVSALKAELTELKAQLDSSTQVPSAPNIDPRITALAESNKLLTLSMSLKQACKANQLVYHVLIDDDEDEENYTREERKTG